MTIMMKKLKIYSLIVVAGFMCSTHALRAQELADTLSASSSRIYSGSTIEKYPTINLMNSFTGVIPGLFVTEQNGMTGMRYNAENCTLTIRGNGTEMYIVDGVMVSQPSEIQLSADEIESISVVSDVLDKLRFGPTVHNGAIRINTVRGIERGRQIRFSVESGVELIDRFPENSRMGHSMFACSVKILPSMRRSPRSTAPAVTQIRQVCFDGWQGSRKSLNWCLSIMAMTEPV